MMDVETDRQEAHMAQLSQQHHIEPSLISLPTEILSRIIELVNTRSDLLSLALANRALGNLILPQHLDLFEIHCYHRDPRGKLWQFMLQAPIRCQRVKILKFVDSPERVLLPREFVVYGGGGDDEGVGQEESPMVLPYEALSKMRNLRCIHLDFCNVSEGYIEKIGEALRNSGCALEELGVIYTGGLTVLYPEPRTMESNSLRLTLFSPDLDLSRLSTLCLKLSRFKKRELDYILHQLLRNATNLTDLIICLDHVTHHIEFFFLSMFTRYKWSKLEKLTLDIHHLHSLSGFNIFYERHPTLKSLFLGVPLICGFFPSKSETRVTSLHSPYMSGPASYIIPDYIAQDLVHLSFGYVNDENTFEGINFPSLRSCVLPQIHSDLVLSNIAKFIQAAPNVQKCWVSFPPTAEQGTKIRNLVSLLRAMPNLTHLMGLFSEIDITTPPGIQLFQSLDELPSVVYADARIGEQPHIIVQLTRYRSDSDYYKIIPPSSSVNTSLDYRTWSGFRPCYRTFSLLGVRGSLDETRALI